MDVAVVIAAFSAAIAIGSAVYTRQQAGASREQATEAKRANDRLDALDAAEAAAASAQAEKNRIRWDLRHLGARRWTLTNAGTDTATRLTLRGISAVLRVTGGREEGDFVIVDEVRPGERIDLVIIPTPDMDTVGGTSLELGWHGSAMPEVFPIPD